MPALANSGACDIDTVVLDVVDRQIIRDNLANSPELAEMRLLWESYETGSVQGCEAVALLELDGDNVLKSLNKIKNHRCDVAKCLDEVSEMLGTGG